MNISINGLNVTVKTKSKNAIYANDLSYTNSDKVNDEKRGFLYYNATINDWVFCGLNQITPSRYDNLILILESPHKDEFSPTGIPLRPANGITGTKINNLLAKHVQYIPGLTLSKSTVYCVWIVNAIQYQTSAYHQLYTVSGYSDYWRSLRDKVFKTMWDSNSPFNLQADLLQRLDTITPSECVNCVTGGKSAYGLRTLVSKAIPQACCYSHPSSWT